MRTCHAQILKLVLYRYSHLHIITLPNVQTKTLGTDSMGLHSTSLSTVLTPFPPPFASGWIPWTGPVMYALSSRSFSNDIPYLFSQSVVYKINISKQVKCLKNSSGLKGRRILRLPLLWNCLKQPLISKQRHMHKNIPAGPRFIIHLPLSLDKEN